MRIATLTALTAFTASLGLFAQAQSVEQIKAELRKRVPEASVDSVRKIPYGNLYEVVAGGEIFYTDDKAAYLVVGPLIDLKTKENVTELRLRQVNAVRFDTLPFDSAIKIVRGNGARKVAIFEDPNCGYCKRFERDLQGVSDITVYVFLYPVLSPDSVEKSKAVWCSADRSKAWLDIMVRDIAVAGDTACTTPIDQLLALGQSKKIHGTPTLIFEDGERAPGAIPIAQFEKKLASLRAPVPTASAK